MGRKVNCPESVRRSVCISATSVVNLVFGIVREIQDSGMAGTSGMNLYVLVANTNADTIRDKTHMT